MTDPNAITTADRLGRRRARMLPMIALFFLMCAWWVTAILAWILILFTGAYPEGLYDFGVGCLGWLIRVEGYMLLLVDEYPPFSFE